MASTSYYIGYKYEPSLLLQVMKKMLDIPRTYYSTDVSNLVSSNEGEKKSYILGLVVVACILLLIMFVWGGILIILKLRGDEAGCAAGYPFKTASYQNEKNRIDRHGSGGGSTDADDFEMSLGTHTESDEEHHHEHHQNHRQVKAVGSDETRQLTPEDIQDLKRTKIREWRTRVALLMVGTLLLLCVPMMLVLVLSPLHKAATNAGTIYLEIQGVINDLNTSILAITDTTISVEQTVNNTPTELTAICPNVTVTMNVSGIDVKQMVTDFIYEFHQLDSVVWNNISAVENVITGSDKAMDSLQSMLHTLNRYFWIIPITLMIASVLTTTSMVATQRAWRKKSGGRLQKFMARVFTPLFILYMILSWMVAIAISLATMLGVDACTAGPSPGTPDVTFQNIFTAMKGTAPSLSLQLVEYYTNGCTGNDPTAVLIGVESTIQNYIDAVWQSVSEVDSVGDTYLASLCGGDGLLLFLQGTQSVAKLLANLRTDIETTRTSLQCSRINPIYENAAYEVLCNETAVASSRGFLLFFVISVASTIIVSLRASWYHVIEEEKVYQDENDIAENMILDEHEEYLAYISKFKHEWQEYRGFKSDSLDEWEGGDDEDDDEGSEELSYLSGSRTEGSMQNEPRTDGERSVEDERCDPSGHDSNTRNRRRPDDPEAKVVVDSIDTQDISFPSLKDPNSDPLSMGHGNGYEEMPPLLLVTGLADNDDLNPWEMRAPHRNDPTPSGAHAIIQHHESAKDPDGATQETYPILFRDEKDDIVDDDDDSDIILNRFPLTERDARGLCREHHGSVTGSQEEEAVEGEGVEVALLSSIPAAAQHYHQSTINGSKGASNRMQQPYESCDDIMPRQPHGVRVTTRAAVEREDMSVESIYTSSSSIMFERAGRKQQRPRRLDPSPTASMTQELSGTLSQGSLSRVRSGSLTRVRTSSPAFQSLVEKFEPKLAVKLEPDNPSFRVFN